MIWPTLARYVVAVVTGYVLARGPVATAVGFTLVVALMVLYDLQERRGILVRGSQAQDRALLSARLKRASITRSA